MKSIHQSPKRRRKHNRKTNRRPNRKHRARRGYAMLLVMVVILTSSAFVAVHQRHLNAALRLEQSRVRSEDYRRGPVTVASIACQRLETGDPPAPISYSYKHTVDAITTLYRVSYKQSGKQWTILAEPDDKAGIYNELPASF